MLELDKKVFGKITTKEIIGAEPPAIPNTKDILEKELEILLAELESQPKENLKKLLEQQKITEKHVNSRPGALWLCLKTKLNYSMNTTKNMFKQSKKN